MAIIDKVRKGFVQLTKKSGAGFTLLEMMIVVAIIGILAASLGLGIYQNSLKKSRDGRRKADLENIRSGLEMYRADQSYYPSSLPSCGGSLKSPDGKVTYIDPIPCDPLPTQRFYSYARPTTITYNLCAALELEGSAVSDCGSNCGTGCNYKRTNP